MSKKYLVELSEAERGYLQGLVSKGKVAARKRMHAQILLKADEGCWGPNWTDARIAESFGVWVRTVERIRQRLVEEGLEEALRVRSPGGGRRRKLDGAGEARLIAVACGAPPEGRRRWTIRLLAERVVELEVVESIGREAVRTTLKKMNLNLG